MSHLTSTQIQAVADGEAPQPLRDHAASCTECAAQVAERRRAAGFLTSVLDGIDIPPAAARRIENALAGVAPLQGATRLRNAPVKPAWRRAAWGAAGLAAATIVAIVFVAPMLKEDRGAVSAAEILAASANRLAQPTTGIELLEYELVVDGAPKDMMPDHANGTYHVRQAIDHSTPGRFRYASFGPDGQPISTIAQDPVTGRRIMMFNLEGQNFRFEVNVPPDVGPSLPQLERLHMEASIAMMLASGNQLLEVVDAPDGRYYRIEVPNVRAAGTNPVWDLTAARVVVNASDYRVTELAVKGTFLKQSYSVSYRLTNRSIVSNLAPDTFDVPTQPGSIVIDGDGSALPARDAMVLALRELARLKNSQR
jgi:hypothetical protein